MSIATRRWSSLGFALTLAGGVSGAEPDTVPHWKAAGWGGGAFYYTASWHPTREDVIYMGGDCAGMYRTEDRAVTWQFANTGINGYGVFSTAVTPAAPDLVYAMTSEGLNRSTDAGKTWTSLPPSRNDQLAISAGKNQSVRAVAIDPHDAKRVYAGARSGKLFMSADAGASWTELPYREARGPVDAGPAHAGPGAFALTYAASTAGDASTGRVSRFYGQGAQAQNWSDAQRLTAQIRVPAGTPAAVQAQIVIQTGSNWAWRQGPWVDTKADTWVEASLDLAGMPDLNEVRMMHVQLRSLGTPWQGEVRLDSVAVQTAAGATVVNAWDQPADAQGWGAVRDAADATCITAAVPTLGKSGEDAVAAVAISAKDPRVVYVANTRKGVFRSQDAGATWTALPGPMEVASLTVSSLHANDLWAACGNDGLKRSRDGGQTWNTVPMQVPGVQGALAVREIALHPAQPKLAYVIANQEWNGVLFCTEDDGATWRANRQVKMGAPGNPTGPEDHGDNPPGFCNLSAVVNIAVNPRNPAELFIAGNWRNVFSADGGKTLVERSTGADNTCATDLQFVGKTVYATAMDEGLLSSDDAGATWRQLHPRKWDPTISGHFWRVRALPTTTGVRLVASGSPWNPTYPGRVFVSDDGGATFTTVTAGLPDYVPWANCMWGRSHPRAMAADPKDPQVLYLGMDGDAESPQRQGGGIFRSADGGRSWNQLGAQPGSRRMFYGLAVDPSDSQRLWWSACGNGGGAWRSDDGGATWTHAFQAEGWSFNLEVAPSGMVLVGGGNLHRSDDHGKTWRQLTAFTDDATVVGIAIDPQDERRMWISRTTWDESTRGGIWRSVDGGATWQEITGDIPYRKPLVLRFNPETSELWAGGVGIFRLAQPR